MKFPVVFRGKQSGLEMTVLKGTGYEVAREAIAQKLSMSKNFFIGTDKVNIVCDDDFTEEQKASLVELLKTEFGVFTVEFGAAMPIYRTAVRTQPEPEIEAESPSEEEAPQRPDTVFSALKSGVTNYRESNSIFVYETVRNGTRVEFDGDIVVCGDVNYGGELVATGSIAVMGALRGIARAGSAGDETAVVAAFKLSPQQLRIGGFIAIAPDGEPESMDYPEIARVKGNEIVISPASRVIK